MDPTKPDLSDVTTEELIDEIRDRHTHVLCIAVRDHKTENADIVMRYLKGPMWALLGLAEAFRSWGGEMFRQSEETEEGE